MSLHTNQRRTHSLIGSVPTVSQHKHPPLGSENHQLHGPYQQSWFRGLHNNVDHRTTETHLISRVTLTLLRNLGCAHFPIYFYVHCCLDS